MFHKSFIQTTMQNLSITETKGLIPCYSYQIVPKYLVFTQQDWLEKAKVNFTQMKAYIIKTISEFR